MATQLETLRLLAPEFASVLDADVQKTLDIAPLIIDPLLFPEDQRGLALVYQACVLLSQRSASANGTAGNGDITSEKEGDLSRSYAISKSDRFGSKNQYQLMLDRLSMNIGMGAMTRMM